MANGKEIGGRWFLPQIETRFIIMDPVVNSQRVSMRANAYCLQNAGNCDILLDGGFTLSPGQIQWLGNYQELNVMNADFQVTFVPATATGSPVVQRLEMIQVLAKFVGSGYWIDQGRMDIVNTAPY